MNVKVEEDGDDDQNEENQEKYDKEVYVPFIQCLILKLTQEDHVKNSQRIVALGGIIKILSADDVSKVRRAAARKPAKQLYDAVHGKNVPAEQCGQLNRPSTSAETGDQLSVAGTSTGPQTNNNEVAAMTAQQMLTLGVSTGHVNEVDSSEISENGNAEGISRAPVPQSGSNAVEDADNIKQDGENGAEKDAIPNIAEHESHIPVIEESDSRVCRNSKSTDSIVHGDSISDDKVAERTNVTFLESDQENTSEMNKWSTPEKIDIGSPSIKECSSENHFISGVSPDTRDCPTSPKESAPSDGVSKHHKGSRATKSVQEYMDWELIPIDFTGPNQCSAPRLGEHSSTVNSDPRCKGYSHEHDDTRQAVPENPETFPDASNCTTPIPQAFDVSSLLLATNWLKELGERGERLPIPLQVTNPTSTNDSINKVSDKTKELSISNGTNSTGDLILLEDKSDDDCVVTAYYRDTTPFHLLHKDVKPVVLPEILPIMKSEVTSNIPPPLLGPSSFPPGSHVFPRPGRRDSDDDPVIVDRDEEEVKSGPRIARRKIHDRYDEMLDDWTRRNERGRAEEMEEKRKRRERLEEERMEKERLERRAQREKERKEQELLYRQQQQRDMNSGRMNQNCVNPHAQHNGCVHHFNANPPLLVAPPQCFNCNPLMQNQYSWPVPPPHIMPPPLMTAPYVHGAHPYSHPVPPPPHGAGMPLVGPMYPNNAHAPSLNQHSHPSQGCFPRPPHPSLHPNPHVASPNQYGPIPNQHNQPTGAVPIVPHPTPYVASPNQYGPIPNQHNQATGAVPIVRPGLAGRKVFNHSQLNGNVQCAESLEPSAASTGPLNKCKYCKYVGDSLEIIAHYVNIHPNKNLPVKLSLNEIREAEKEMVKETSAPTRHTGIHCLDDLSWIPTGSIFSNEQTCKLCPFKGKIRSSFIQHVQAHKEKKLAEMPRPAPTVPRFCCRFCDETYAEINGFYEHSTGHTGEYAFKCSLCKFKGQTRCMISVHKSQDHPNKVVTANPTVFKRVLDGSVLEGYACSLCGFIQLTKRNVESHINGEHHKGNAKVLKINMSRSTPRPKPRPTPPERRLSASKVAPSAEAAKAVPVPRRAPPVKVRGDPRTALDRAAVKDLATPPSLPNKVAGSSSKSDASRTPKKSVSKPNSSPKASKPNSSPKASKPNSSPKPSNPESSPMKNQKPYSIPKKKAPEPPSGRQEANAPAISDNVTSSSQLETNVGATLEGEGVPLVAATETLPRRASPLKEAVVVQDTSQFSSDIIIKSDGEAVGCLTMEIEIGEVTHPNPIDEDAEMETERESLSQLFIKGEKDSEPQYDSDDSNDTVEMNFDVAPSQETVASPPGLDASPPTSFQDALAPAPSRDALAPPPNRDALASPPNRDAFAPPPSRDALAPSPNRDALAPSPNRDALGSPQNRDALSPSPKQNSLTPLMSPDAVALPSSRHTPVPQPNQGSAPALLKQHPAYFQLEGKIKTERVDESGPVPSIAETISKLREQLHQEPSGDLAAREEETPRDPPSEAAPVFYTNASSQRVRISNRRLKDWNERCKVLICGCLFAARSNEAFTKHREYWHKGEKRAACPECSAKFDTASDFADHQWRTCPRSGMRIYACSVEPLCRFTTSSQINFITHIKEEHAEIEWLPCYWCGKKYTTSDCLAAHLHSQCNTKIPMLSALQSNVASLRNNPIAAATTEDLRETSSSPEEPAAPHLEVVYRCYVPGCQHESLEREVLIDHIQVDHPERKEHGCFYCGGSFGSIYSLVLHLEDKHRETASNPRNCTPVVSTINRTTAPAPSALIECPDRVSSHSATVDSHPEESVTCAQSVTRANVLTHLPVPARIVIPSLVSASVSSPALPQEENPTGYKWFSTETRTISNLIGRLTLSFEIIRTTKLDEAQLLANLTNWLNIYGNQKGHVVPTRKYCIDPLVFASRVKSETAMRVILDDLEKLAHLYKCAARECTFTSSSEDEFRDHLLLDKCRTDNLIHCLYCGEQHKTVCGAVSHVSKRHVLCIFQCPHCIYRTKTQNYLLFHIAHAHKEENGPMVRLMVCPAPRPANLEDELPDLFSLSVPVACAVDGCTFLSLDPLSLLNHHQVVHADLPAISCFHCMASCPPSEIEKHFQEHQIFNIQCRYCSFGTTAPEDIVVHLCGIHPNRTGRVVLRTCSQPPVVSNAQGCSSAPQPPQMQGTVRIKEEPVDHDENCDPNTSSGGDAVDTAIPSTSSGPSTSQIGTEDIDIPSTSVPSAAAAAPAEPNLHSCGYQHCRYSTNRLHELGIHLTECSRRYVDDLLYCKQCLSTFRDPASFLEHLRSHLAKVFICGLCDYTAQLPHYMKSHLRGSHNLAFEDTKCRCRFPDSDSLSEAAEYIYEPVVPKLVIRQDPSGNAGLTSEVASANVAGKSSVPEDLTVDDVDSIPTQSIFVNPLKCRHCKYSNKVRRNLIRHVEQCKRDRATNRTAPETDPSNGAISASSSSSSSCVSASSADTAASFSAPTSTADTAPFFSAPTTSADTDAFFNAPTSSSDTAASFSPPATTADTAAFFRSPTFSADTAASFSAPTSSVGATDSSSITEPTNGRNNNNNPSLRIWHPRQVPEYVNVKERFRCCIGNCARLESSSAAYEAHITSAHADVLRLPCPHCGDEFADISDFHLHIRLHGPNLFRCSYCTYHHYHRNLVSGHCLDQHPGVPALVRILRQEHEIDVPENSLVSNWRRSCAESAVRTMSVGPAIEVPSCSEASDGHGMPAFTCKTCKTFTTSSKSLMRAHIIEELKLETYSCSRCTHTCGTSDAIQEHFGIAHVGEIPDFRIGIDPRHDALIDQLLESQEEKQCSLNRQMNLGSASSGNGNDHHGGKGVGSLVYPCLECKFVHPDKSIARIHILTHLQKQNNKCTLCNSKFSRLQHLRRHHTSAHPGMEFVSHKEKDVQIETFVDWVLKLLEDAAYEGDSNITRPIALRCQKNGCLMQFSDLKKFNEHFKKHVHRTLVPQGGDANAATPGTSSDLNFIEEQLDGGGVQTNGLGFDLHCPYCNFNHVVKANVSRHILRHYDFKFFMCGHCAFEALQHKDIASHCRNVHEGLPEAVIEKPRPETLELRKVGTRPLIVVSLEQVDGSCSTERNGKYQCSECLFSTSGFLYARYHCQNRHPKASVMKVWLGDPKAVPDNQLATAAEIDGECIAESGSSALTQECNMCHERLVGAKEYLDHIVEKHPGCGSSLGNNNTKRKQKQHDYPKAKRRAIPSGSKATCGGGAPTDVVAYRCKVCKKQFREMVDLRTHFRVFHPTEVLAHEDVLREEMYRCPKCSFASVFFEEAKKHVLHDHAFPFLCGLCSKFMWSHDSVVRHSRSKHKNEQADVKRNPLYKEQRSALIRQLKQSVVKRRPNDSDAAATAKEDEVTVIEIEDDEDIAEDSPVSDPTPIRSDVSSLPLSSDCDRNSPIPRTCLEDSRSTSHCDKSVPESADNDLLQRLDDSESPASPTTSCTSGTSAASAILPPKTPARAVAMKSTASLIVKKRSRKRKMWEESTNLEEHFPDGFSYYGFKPEKVDFSKLTTFTNFRGLRNAKMNGDHLREVFNLFPVVLLTDNRSGSRPNKRPHSEEDSESNQGGNDSESRN